ncbi:hypothetical protein ACFYKX_26545 [Cytobacillus sp. FJAT-54145]|uniref:Scaffolding protein n=1 Tax=Cytobacillus spartinae TaxID=3299023 RepID=A0ABW6KIW9_9BACI
MFENEDVILPDDYQEAPPQAEEAQEDNFEEVETVEETTETEVNEEPQEQLTEEQKAFLRVKYNKEELELDENTARELAQKGLNYDKLQEKLQQFESDPRLSFVEELAREQGMDVNQYLEAVKEWKEQERLNELVQKNIPEDLAKEILETRKMREEIQNEKKQKAEQEKQSQEFNEFFQFFKDANGRDYDPQNDKLPDEVWQMQNQGVPLKFAYMQHQHNELKTQLKILKQNEENTKKAPVTSVSTHGSQEIASEDDFLRGFDSI